jgi:endonuclease YncB( thermonuclease family)
MRIAPLNRLRWRRHVRSACATALLAALAFAVWMSVPDAATSVALVHVIDGDSLAVKRGAERITIRLTGLDAVEYRQDCARDDEIRWPCGRGARAALEKMVGRGPLHCDLSANDVYHRTLASCRTHPFPEGVDIGAAMVRQGWAVATSDAYVVEEAEAQAARRGIWQGRFDRPADWRAAHARPASARPSPDV